MRKRRKRYSEMTVTELRKATREFDREVGRFPPERALTAAQRRTFSNARGRGTT